MFVLLLSIMHLTFTINKIIEDSGERTGTGDAFLVVYTVAIVWFTVGLCLYHSYLICTNQTTYEQIKGVYSTGANPQNPFHRGILGNCQDILCSKIRPRYFDAAENRLLWNVTPT